MAWSGSMRVFPRTLGHIMNFWLWQRRWLKRCAAGLVQLFGVFMFPEYRALITQLKTSDAHFHSLFQQHNTLDQQVKRMASRTEPSTPAEIETLKKEKLRLKDAMYVMLQKASQSE